MLVKGATDVQRNPNTTDNDKTHKTNGIETKFHNRVESNVHDKKVEYKHTFQGIIKRWSWWHLNYNCIIKRERIRVQTSVMIGASYACLHTKFP